MKWVSSFWFVVPGPLGESLFTVDLNAKNAKKRKVLKGPPAHLCVSFAFNKKLISKGLTVPKEPETTDQEQETARQS